MTKARTTIRDRVEQAIAFGRSLDWMCDNLHVEPAYVDRVLRGMDAAAASVDPDPEPPEPLFTYQGRPLSSYFGPADPSTIRELVDALCPPRVVTAERDETVLRFIAQGFTDTEIAAHIGSTRSSVGTMRRRLVRAA